MSTQDLNYLLPLTVAREKGFFQEQNLLVEWQQMPANAGLPALLSRAVDYSQAGSAMQGAAQGAPMRAIFFPYNTSTFQVVVNPRIREPRDLIGQPIAISTPGATQDRATKLLLASWGIEVTSVNFVSLGNESARVAAMVSDQVVGAADNPDVAVGLVRRGYVILGNTSKVLNTPFAGFGVHTDYLREQRPAVNAWLRATIKALQYIHQNPDESAELVGKTTAIEAGVAREALPYLLEVMDPADPGGWTEAGMLEQVNIIKAADERITSLSIDDISDVAPLREVQRELGIRCRGGYKCE
jgi:ABC-type nitrate/sulfonate/bicarbonate transport system substrate-binding protein